ncbi:MAG: molecular chaperone TorD family protein [Burkholderiaceae bacterium]
MSDPDATRAAARADLCRFLAACYYLPGPEFAEERVFDSMRDAASKLDPELAQVVDTLGNAFAAAPLQDLQVDYTALFLSPTGAAAMPYESSWVAGRDPMRTQEAAEEVRRFYAEAGFEIDDEFRDLPDHIAAEMELLFALIFREARARAIGDPTDELAATELRLRFLRAHLGRWVAPFTEALRAEAETDFYRALADVTRRFVSGESA